MCLNFIGFDRDVPVRKRELVWSKMIMNDGLLNVNEMVFCSSPVCVFLNNLVTNTSLSGFRKVNATGLVNWDLDS
jgi:hypothetical protein